MNPKKQKQITEKILKEEKFLKKRIDEKIESMKKAEKEYEKEQKVIYENIKKQFNISDSDFQNAFDTAEPDSLISCWEDGLYKLQSKLERKYKIFEIEQDDDMLIMFDCIDGWSIRFQNGEIEVENTYIEKAISQTIVEMTDLKDEFVKKLKKELFNLFDVYEIKIVNDGGEMILREHERKRMIESEINKTDKEVFG